MECQEPTQRQAMRILPVIDLKSGSVVRGVAGQRDRYLPIQSKIAADATPTGVASAFADTLNFEDVYVADLDAIEGAEPDWGAYRSISAAGLRLWLDAGIADVDRALQLSGACDTVNVHRLIVGLESLRSPSIGGEVVAAAGPSQAVFSLDLRNGIPLVDGAAWEHRTPLELAGWAVEVGISSLLVLDVGRVGTGTGTGSDALCALIRSRYPHIELLAGGGVRGLADLTRMHDAGVDGVLVASALHDGVLGRRELESL